MVYDESEYLDAIRQHTPATTKEIADAVGVTRQGADYRLRKMREDGLVKGDLVGNTLIWSVTDGVDETASDQRESDPSPSPTEGSEPIGGGHEPPSDDLAAVVDTIAEDWDDRAERLAARKAAARAVLEYAREHGTVSKKEAKEQIEPEYSVEDQTPRTWYRKNIRPVLNEAGEYDQSERAYRLDLEDA